MYLQGFGNYHQSEALSNALPKNQNSPQACPLGLYAEQLSGTAFTRPRANNLHTWTYKILPSVAHGQYRAVDKIMCSPFAKEQSPNPLRWDPLGENLESCDFIDGLFHMAGSPLVQAYLYHCTLSMEDKYFVNHDGELLFIPYRGEINLRTELGLLPIKPEMIAVIPRGITFKVELISQDARGYLCENKGTPLALPELGILGANGLANPRHFNYPKAHFEEVSKKPRSLLCKHRDRLWLKELHYSPLDVVAWHGNYAPYSYDLNCFNTLNTVSFDHPDPSIFTVLSSASDTPGIANLDFVIFPSRWMVAEHSMRLPYFHRNVMNEFMGLITGHYDAKEQGFAPGGVSIHTCMTPHGPDKKAYEAAVSKDLTPEKYTKTLAFMLETRDVWQVSEKALNLPSRQSDYVDCWLGFTPILK